ncbi:UvrD-helicase domain-containing protein, partial [Xanthomonas citri pv. citri]
LILRATERGVSAEQLEELGVQYSRPMWEAAGQFLRRYEQLQRLSESDNLNASELVHTVVRAMSTEEAGQQMAETLRQRLQLVLVDDAHNIDPAAAQFVESLIAPGTRALIAGDPDQCVFHFRGADEAFLNRHAVRDDFRIVLSSSH